MTNTNDTNKFSLQHGSGTAIKSHATAKSKRRTYVRIPGPPIIALAVVNKSLAVFISKYVLSGLYRENCRGSVCRLGSRMTVMFGNV